MQTSKLAQLGMAGLVFSLLAAAGTASGADRSPSEHKALAAAKRCLADQAYSKQGLIHQLESTPAYGFSAQDAQAAVDHLPVNWQAQAVRAAQAYLATQDFSKKSLIRQLDSPTGAEFTTAQAQSAVNSLHFNWQEEAVMEAQGYLAAQPFSRRGLIDQMDSPSGGGFSVKTAQAAVNSLQVNWKEEAAADAKTYAQTEDDSCQQIIEQLSGPDSDGYTPSQAKYGARKAGACATVRPAIHVASYAACDFNLAHSVYNFAFNNVPLDGAAADIGFSITSATFQNGWEVDKSRQGQEKKDVVAIGITSFNGTRLPACVEKVVVHYVNRSKGERKSACYEMGYVDGRNSGKYHDMSEHTCRKFSIAKWARNNRIRLARRLD